MTRRKKTPVVACGICGQPGHTSEGHNNQGTGIYATKRPARKNILGKKKR